MSKHVVFITVRAMFITLVVLSCGTKEEEFDWPRWRGPNGNGISNEANWDPETLSGGPKILWRVDVGMGHSNVAIRDNRLYTMGVTKDGNTVVCLNADTGQEIWRYSFESSHESQSTATTDGKFVYTLNTEGILLCLKARNGKLRWKKELVNDYKTERIPYGYTGAPVVEDDLIIMNVNTAGIALSKKSGELIWGSNVHTSKRNMNGYHATPVLFDHKGKRCALLFSSTGLFCVEVETGKQVWVFEYPLGTANCADPILIDDKVFISAGYTTDQGTLLEITGDEPKVVWQNKNMGTEFSTCAYVDGYLYGSDGDANGFLPFRCIDAKTGDVMWEEKMKMVSITVADRKLIVLEEDGILHIAEATPSSYKETSCCQLPSKTGFHKWWTPPVLCNGRIYCRNWAGDLVCIDVSK